MKNRQSTILYAVSLLCVFLGSFSLKAQDSETKLEKKAVFDYTTRTGTITLDSYVTGYVKVVRQAVPADIVLVLDFSSSMKDNSKNTMLQTAASAFVDSLALSAKKNNVNHRIGVITFGTGAHIKTDFLSVHNNATNVETIKSYINSTCPAPNEGATRYELAMMLAKNMIDGGTKIIDIPQQTNSNSAKVNNIYTSSNTEPEVTLYVESGKCVEGTLQGVQSGSSPFVVFLTDGEPTGATNLGTFKLFYGQGAITTKDTPGEGGEDDGSRYGSSSSWSDDHMFGIANHAIQTSYYLKNTKNTSVYCIQVGTPSGDGKKYLCQDALTAISSLYKSATRYRQKYWGTITSGTTPFYQHITSVSQASISYAFEQIAGSIQKVINVQYGVETKMTDFINNAYFKLTDAVDPANPWATCHVYTVDCKDVASDDTRLFYELGTDTHTTELHASDGINLTITKATTTGENDKVEVTGFNYSENWCGKDEHNAIHGKKLVVTLPFKFTGGLDTPVPGTVKTNADSSGIYPAKRNEKGEVITPVQYDTEPEAKYESPVITFCTLKITRIDLDKGESAVYEVYSNGSFVARVSLNGTGAKSVSRTLYGLPGGSYTVTETGWNWAYVKGENPITKTLSDPSKIEEFYFTGAHIVDEDSPAGLHNHDEEYKVNKLDVSGL